MTENYILQFQNLMINLHNNPAFKNAFSEEFLNALDKLQDQTYKHAIDLIYHKNMSDEELNTSIAGQTAYETIILIQKLNIISTVQQKKIAIIYYQYKCQSHPIKTFLKATFLVALLAIGLILLCTPFCPLGCIPLILIGGSIFVTKLILCGIGAGLLTAGLAILSANFNFTNKFTSNKFIRPFLFVNELLQYNHKQVAKCAGFMAATNSESVYKPANVKINKKRLMP